MSPPTGSAPVLHAALQCAADWIAWQDPARGTFVAVVAKVTFAFLPGETCAVMPPAPLASAERHVDRSPLRELSAASDAAPFLARPELLVVGHAHAPGGRATPSLGVHIALGRQTVTFRRTLHVFGDRESEASLPLPFRRMPLAWERAVRTGDNPVGIDPALRPANLVDPRDPSRPAGTGPISALWEPRRLRLGGARRAALSGEPMTLPAGFDGAYFQAAPTEQWLDTLIGDEWICLDGLHPTLPRVQTKLPGLRIGARFEGPRGGRTVELRPDRLLLDTDQQCGTLVYRGSQPIDPAELGAYRIFVGIASPGAPVAWPDAGDPATLRLHTLGLATPGTAAAPLPVLPLDETTSLLEPIEDEETASIGPSSAATLTIPLPFAAPRRRDVQTDDDESTAGTAVIDVAALLAQGTALPFVGAPTAPAPPARVAPPPLVVEETAFDDMPSHPAEALPFLASPPDAVRASAPSTAGLPFAAPPSVGPLPARPREPADDAPPSQLPEPRGDVVPTFTDGPFVVATLGWQLQPPKDSLTVIVKGSFQLAEGAPAVACPEPELPMGDVFADDEPDKPLLRASDFAIMKPQCDVLVMGSAHAPGGASRAMQIALRVKGAGGRVDRALTVFGDRTWQRAVVAVAPTEPASFDSIPLGWGRAFGGDGFGANPHGVGYRARPGVDGVVRLPNFETPGQHIKSPDDVPPPASLSPIHPQWKPRASLLGTYDRAWFHERWPYFPRDFDYHHFQAAPPAQRLEKASGDETYELVGLVPGKPKLEGRLPGLKVRVFARKTAEAGGALVEIPMKLDTITFATEHARVDLVWRGWTEVSDDDAPELERIFATAEPAGGPALTLDEVTRRYDAALLPPADQDPPEVPLEADADTEADEGAQAARRLDAELDAEEAARREELRARGLDLDAPAVAPPIPPAPAALGASLRAAGATEADVAEVLAALAEPPGEDDAAAPTVDLRRLVQERVARGEPLAGLDLRGADLRDLELAGQSFAGSDLAGARLDRAVLEGADLSGASLVGASLAAARAGKAVFTGADLTGAELEDAVFEGASFDDATLADVRAGKADFRKASAPGASFVGARLAAARFEGAALGGADFTGAHLDAAVFDGAAMVKVRLYDARGKKASFVGCDLTNARCEGAVFVHGTFREVKADDSVWERADLTSSTFQGASLVSSSFVRAKCHKTSFNEADLSTARLRKAHMNGATFVKANLFEASLERADLELADLRGTNLHGATIWKTQLEHARLEHAVTSYSALGRKQP